MTFGKGGFQESRGSLNNAAGDWFVENVFEVRSENSNLRGTQALIYVHIHGFPSHAAGAGVCWTTQEFDSVNEFYWAKRSQKLYYFHNGTGPPDPTSRYEAPQQRTLFNLNASRWQPIHNVTIRGLTLTGTRYTYMDPHGVPSAGDFAIARSAAVNLEGTVGAKIEDCNLTRLDGNGILVSGFNRNATIAQNTFSWIGDNAVVVWGRTNETATNPLEGFDGTDGNHPQFTKVLNNVIREIGIYEKQSSWYFQAKAAQSSVVDNILFNAPRNGITMNDPFAGGDLIRGNLAFSAMRETVSACPS